MTHQAAEMISAALREIAHAILQLAIIHGKAHGMIETEKKEGKR